MEIQFQQQKTPSKIRVRNNKFIGVRQRASGRWVAEIKDTTQKIRMWLGTFKTAEEAARAYDEAACLLRGPNTRTNFVTQVSPNSLLASRINNLLNNKKKKSTKGKKQESTSEFDCSQKKIDEVYKPDLTNCAGDAWGFDEELFLFEFERIRVERQISASLYAINDYMDTLYDPTQPLWDLPPLSSLLT